MRQTKTQDLILSFKEGRQINWKTVYKRKQQFSYVNKVLELCGTVTDLLSSLVHSTVNLPYIYSHLLLLYSHICLQSHFCLVPVFS